jgi:hypothetical protein
LHRKNSDVADELENCRVHDFCSTTNPISLFSKAKRLLVSGLALMTAKSTSPYWGDFPNSISRSSACFCCSLVSALNERRSASESLRIFSSVAMAKKAANDLRNLKIFFWIAKQ